MSSSFRLDRLGYAVLSAFDTMAYHLFEFSFGERRFDLPSEDDFGDEADMTDVKLADMGLKIGDRIRMDYDYGTTQAFYLELIEIADMPKGGGRRYPCITDGAGRGIIDDMSRDELIKLVKQIDKNGHTNKPVYYKEREIPWDYRAFDLQLMNMIFKREIQIFEENYLL